MGSEEVKIVRGRLHAVVYKRSRRDHRYRIRYSRLAIQHGNGARMDSTVSTVE